MRIFFNLNVGDFKGDKFSTVDGLYITKSNSKFIFHFFEFKKIDFGDQKDGILSKYHFDNILSQIEKCPSNCNYSKTLNKIKPFLQDKEVCSMKVKPYESLSLLYYLFEYYSKKYSINISTNFYNVEKRFYIVSKTSNELNSPFDNNKSNSHRRTNISEFNFIFKIKPFPFKEASAFNSNTFLKFINLLHNKNEIIL